MNLYVFYKFAALNLILTFRFYIWVLRTFFFLVDRSLAGLGREQREGASRIPARRLAGGEGKVGEKGEESRAHLLVGFGGSGMVGEGRAAEQRRNRNSGEVVGIAPAMVVAGWMGLRLWEVQEDEADPFRGSIGVEGGCMGCYTELRRRPAMEAAVGGVPVRDNGD